MTDRPAVPAVPDQETLRALGLVRDGTLFGPNGTEIDLRTPDYEAWVTIKSDDDALAERIAAVLAADPSSTPEDDDAY